jgi:hypothetical protein
MLIYKGGTNAGKGLYWDPMEGQRVDLQNGDILPGDHGNIFLKVSPAALLIITPLFGMMYVMFLPLFGIGVFIVSWLVIIISSLARLALTGIQVCNRLAARSVFFNWRPSDAYFSGLRKKQRGAGKNKKNIQRSN